MLEAPVLADAPVGEAELAVGRVVVEERDARVEGGVGAAGVVEGLVDSREVAEPGHRGSLLCVRACSVRVQRRVALKNTINAPVLCA
ncbi:MAG: hypothetical protein FJ138_12010 [Deltaproteobacteria bacterium]|nr:hypothetical protein [Deltaproteobacteria bacterium]